MSGIVECIRRLVFELRPVLQSHAMVISLALLTALDLAFVAMHIVHVLAKRFDFWSVFEDFRFHIGTDGSYSEWFEYAKAAICALALVGCWVRTRQPVYAALSAVFGFTLADNALLLHERFGEEAAVAFKAAEGAFKNAPEALGQLAFYAVLGPLLLGLVGLSYLATAAEHRAFGLAFVLLLAALGVFGVGVDLIHAVLRDAHAAMNGAFVLVEDGGELFIHSTACALSIATYVGFAAERRAPLRH